ncbi:hypothetical protein [Caenimonas sp. SL110]|uniref:hypothetical protein n=1 Tax=Caenimonas sp. SL110 TaxID=1450524 RepID=UPI0006548ACD|nr:hypothetical protein [Caenimonas sp. SL110]
MKVTTVIGGSGLFSTLRQRVTPKPRTGSQATGRSDDRSRISNAFRALCRRGASTSTPGQCVRKSLQGGGQGLVGLTASAPQAAATQPNRQQGSDGSPQERVHAAVALALADLPKPGEALYHELPDGLVEGLLELQRRLAGADADDESFARLVAVLCDHARIRDYAAHKPGLALEGLKAMVDVMCESIRHDRDGLALNALVGLDNKLDGAIIKLRTRCVRDLMLSQSDRQSQATYGAVQSAIEDATQLVELEADLARARVQMLQAFEAAGIARTMGGIAGQKMTANLVRGLRKSLGEKKSSQVGLAIAHVYLLERRIAGSACGKRMLDDVHLMRLKLWEQSNEVDRSTPAGRAKVRDLHAEIRYLEQRAESLEQEAAACGVGGLTDDELKRLGLPPALQDFVGPQTEAARQAREAAELQTQNAICKLASQGLSSAAQTHNAVTTINAVMQAWLGARGLEKLAEGGGIDMLCGGKGEDRARRFGQRLALQTAGPKAAELRKLTSIVEQEIAPALKLIAVQDPSVLLATRRKLLGPAVSAALRDAIRGAALQQVGATPLHRFTPAEHTSAVWHTLKSWGIPAHLVGPEIDACLGEPFDEDALQRWVADADLPPEQVDTPTARDALFKGIDEMKLGTRLKLVAGKRVEVQTGYIPLDPSMITETNIRAAGGTSTALEIAHISDAGASVFELTFRAGFDLKIGAEIWANIAGSKQLGVDFDVMGTSEGAYQRLNGVSLRFASRQALSEALEMLLASTPEAPVSASSLHGARSILPLVDNKVSSKAGVGAKVGIDIGTQQVGGDPRARHVGATASLRAMLQTGAGASRSRSLNTLESIEKSEHETVVEGSLSAMAGAEFKAGPSVDRTSWSATVPVVQAGISISSVVKRKLKILRGRDGLVQQGTERMSQAYLGKGNGLAAAARVGGPAFTRLMQELAIHDKPAADAVLALIGDVQQNELFSVAYTLDPKISDEINALYKQARNHRTGRAGGGTPREAARRADKLEQQARALLDDEHSYLIERIAIIPSAERLETLTQLNLVLLQKNTYTEERSEYVAMQVKPDLAISARVRDELRAAKLVRERAKAFRT